MINLNLSTPVSCHLIPDTLILKMTHSKQLISAALYQISLHLHPCGRKTDSKINLFVDVKHFTILHNLITFNIKFQRRKKQVVFHREGQKQSNSSWTSYHTPLYMGLGDASSEIYNMHRLSLRPRL